MKNVTTNGMGGNYNVSKEMLLKSCFIIRLVKMQIYYFGAMY